MKNRKKTQNTRTLRIPKGELSATNPLDLLVNLRDLGMTDDDIRRHTAFGFDYSGCYYEGDTPSIVIEWGNIYEDLG